jgi:predicted enzyme related to lactoylglutathione lyase
LLRRNHLSVGEGCRRRNNMSIQDKKPGLIRKVDCIRIPVPNLEAGLKFYQDALGHELIWRTKTSIGLRIPESEAEIVIHTERDEPETDLTVEDVNTAVQTFVESGGSIVTEPFDIPIGKCAVVKDPWGNQFVLLDNSKGLFITDNQGNVIGIESSGSKAEDV